MYFNIINFVSIFVKSYFGYMKKFVFLILKRFQRKKILIFKINCITNYLLGPNDKKLGLKHI